MTNTLLLVARGELYRPAVAAACKAQHALKIGCCWSVQMGHQVVGAYISPVNDAYKKANLVAGKHRVAMSHLAAEQLPYLEADGWEAEQPEYQPTLNVLKHFSQWQHPGMQQSSTGAQPPELRSLFSAEA